MRNDSTVLVTGAAGFVGSNIVGALRASMPAAELLGLDRLPVSGDYDSCLALTPDGGHLVREDVHCGVSRVKILGRTVM